MKKLWIKLTSFSFMTGKNYAIDFCFFHRYNSFSEALSLIDFDAEIRWFKGDHNPQFVFFFALLNFAIIDICWYNIHHIDDKEVN